MTEFQRMVNLLDEAWHLRSEIVPCLVGPVGIGKTAAVMQHAENVKAGQVVTIIASQVLPSEVSGITMPDEKTKSMEIYDHYRLSSLKDGDILFFDELLEADQSVLSACLTLIEGRMMMSGRQLPDIQIIAATNPTVQPSIIRENIRQRFMFMKFGIDREQLRDYIKDKTGMVLPDCILTTVTGSGNNYNILSPRSLTKLCLWMDAVPANERDKTAGIINEMWSTNLGSQLMAVINKRDNIPAFTDTEQQVVDIIFDELGQSWEDFDDDETSFKEVIEWAKEQPQWEKIEDRLRDIIIKVHDDESVEIQW